MTEGSESSSSSGTLDKLGVASVGSGISFSSGARGGGQAPERVIGIVCCVYMRCEVRIYCHGPITLVVKVARVSRSREMDWSLRSEKWRDEARSKE